MRQKCTRKENPTKTGLTSRSVCVAGEVLQTIIFAKGSYVGVQCLRVESRPTGGWRCPKFGDSFEV